MDITLTWLGIIAEVLLVAALLHRKYWLKSPVLFYILMFEVAETPIYIALHYINLYYAYHAWFWFDKLNILLDITAVAFCFCEDCPLFQIALFTLIHASMKLAEYSDLDVDWMLQKDTLYYVRAIVNVALAFYIALAVYDPRMGSPLRSIYARRSRTAESSSSDPDTSPTTA